MNERLSAGAMISLFESMKPVLTLARVARPDGTVPADDPLVRQRLAHAYTSARLFDLTTARVRTALAREAIPGPEVSILKLFAALAGTELAEAGISLLGAAGTLAGDDGPDAGRWVNGLLSSFAMHIGGGTDEIQRNIIGETVLGLPREPSVDKDLPFRALTTRSS
jgi:alkylation response protein AidB-like acyl-CoA dehydrogenase